MAKKVNLTIELEDEAEILEFENWIKYYVTVIDFTHLTDTKELYENDSYFRKISNQYYDLKRLRNDYINSKL